MKMLLDHGKTLIKEFAGSKINSSTEDAMTKRLKEMSGLDVVTYHIQPAYLFFQFDKYNLRIIVSRDVQEYEVEAVNEDQKTLHSRM